MVEIGKRASIDDMEEKYDNPLHASPINKAKEDVHHSSYLMCAKLCAKNSGQSVSPEEVAKWSPQRIIRWVTCSVDDEKNKAVLLVYAETIELLCSRFPDWSVSEKVDWAIAK